MIRAIQVNIQKLKRFHWLNERLSYDIKIKKFYVKSVAYKKFLTFYSSWFLRDTIQRLPIHPLTIQAAVHESEGILCLLRVPH